MGPAGPTSNEETVVQNETYRITRRRADSFLIIRLSGRCGGELLDDLRSKVFIFKSNYAVDISGLTGVTGALVRELAETAGHLRSGERRLALINPPEAVRSLLSTHPGRAVLEIVFSEEHLREAAPGGDAGGVHTLRELERLRKEFQTNRHWQFIDREGCWICPFCAAVQTDVVLSSLLSLPAAALEKAYRHLWSKCPEYKPTAPRLRPLPELQEVLRKANHEKMIVPRRQMDQMESQIAALKGKTEEFESSVKRASERQRRLLPAEAPALPGAEIDLIYRPAAVVSGDFYDFVPLDDGKTAILVGDVSGHGIEAGIVMGMTKKVLSIRLQDFQDPVEALVRTNDDVDQELGRVSFVTTFIAVFDPAARTLTCVRAGHNPPLLFNPAREERCLQLKPAGMGLGILGQSSFEPSLQRLEIPIQSGDVLLMYTDGLVEARNPAGEQFGIDRTTQALAATYGYSPALVLSGVADAMDGFTGNRVSEDDITAVCIRFQ